MILLVTVAISKQIMTPIKTSKEIMNEIDLFFDILSQLFNL